MASIIRQECWVYFKHSKVLLVRWKSESKENGKERTEDGFDWKSGKKLKRRDY